MDDGKMTATFFDELRPRLGRLTDETIDIAREVLVEGKSQSDVARNHGLSRQRVSSMVKSVISAANEVPRDWQRVEVWLPPNLADKVRQMEADAKEEVAKMNHSPNTTSTTLGTSKDKAKK